MPKTESRVRTIASYVLLGLCLTHALLALLPMPTFGLWTARLVAKELTLVAAVLAVAGMVLARSHWVRGLSFTALIWAVRPLVGALPLLSLMQTSFSFREYLTGAPHYVVPVQKDVLPEPSRPELLVDIYPGSGDLPRPFALVIHGGSWQRGDKGEVPQISSALAAAGVTVFDVRYRLAPEHPFPAAISDVKCLLGRLREQGARYGIDPRRAMLLGRSAGGHIALLTAYSAGDAAIPPSCAVPAELEALPVQTVVGIYPLTDMVYAWDNVPLPDLLDSRDTLTAFLGGSPAQYLTNYQRATPMTWVKRPGSFPSTILVHGLDDILVKPLHSQRLYDALVAAGRKAQLLGIPGADHGFDFRSGGLGEQIERAAVLAAARKL